MLFQLNVHSSEFFPITFYDADHKNETLSVKVSSLSSESVAIKDYSIDSSNVFPQAEFGAVIQDGHFTTFELNVKDVSYLNLKLELIIQQKVVAVGYVTSNQFKDCTGNVIAALVCPTTQTLVASASCDYLALKSWKEHPLSSSVASRQDGFVQEFSYMGHRGLGKTYARTDTALENTIESFVAAHELGASFVELDIQITKDKVPVIFHDFVASVISEDQLVTVPVENLTSKELRSLKMDFAREGAGTHYDERFGCLFPTLEEFLVTTPQSLGVMIEVKFPYKDGKTGEWEVDHYLKRNEVVDLVLDIVMSYQGDRRIIFGSFDPEVCLMLQHKQAKYHVMLITSGENDLYFYADLRNQTRGMAAHFALAHNLLGISIMSDPLFDKKEELANLVNTLKKNNKHLITWGSKNSNLSFVETQKLFGVSAVISDE